MTDTTDMVPVIVESPFAGEVSKHLRYLRAAMHDCLLRGEAPYASHALYTQRGVLDDNVEKERWLGIHAGFVWRKLAHKTVVYTDFGISKGMAYGVDHAKEQGHSIEMRKLRGEVMEWVRGASPLESFETFAGIVVAPKDLTGPPEVFTNGTDTSSAAADSIRSFAGTMEAEVLSFIKNQRNGATDYEIEGGLNMPHQTASARRRGLVIKSLVADSGLRRPTGSGRQAIVWVAL